MANHVQNVLRIEGVAIQNVRRSVASKKSVFDFNEIYPLPEEAPPTGLRRKPAGRKRDGGKTTT